MLQHQPHRPSTPLSKPAPSARLAACLVALLGVVGCERTHTSGGGDATDTVADPSDTAVDDPSDAAVDDASGDTAAADTGAGDTAVPATQGLPEGVSTWSGQLEVSGVVLLADATITNSGGDLTATLQISDSPDAPIGIGAATYTLSGTHDPGSGLVALAPGDWTVAPPFMIELDGFDGRYDPDADQLVGVVADYASGTDNTLGGGPVTLNRTSGEGAPTTVVASPTLGLAVGVHTFSGTLQCTGPVRDVAGDLTWDGAGRVTGAMTIGDPNLATPLGRFDFTGVHNPATGGITLVPKLWIEPDHSTLTFFVDGTYAPSTGHFEGDQRTNTAACPDATWHTVIE